MQLRLVVTSFGLIAAFGAAAWCVPARSAGGAALGAGVPENHVIGMMLAVGKAVSPAHPRGGSLERHEVVFENSF